MVEHVFMRRVLCVFLVTPEAESRFPIHRKECRYNSVNRALGLLAVARRGNPDFGFGYAIWMDGREDVRRLVLDNWVRGGLVGLGWIGLEKMSLL
jgi:hypothetical protein